MQVILRFMFLFAILGAVTGCGGSDATGQPPPPDASDTATVVPGGGAPAAPATPSAPKGPPTGSLQGTPVKAD